jgi:NitT/TauT family transport system substrate-binding protein
MTSHGLGERCERRLSRRELLGHVAAAGTAALVGGRPRAAAAEPPPETTRIRLVGSRALCFAPQFVAEELLRDEGFSDVEYITKEPSAELLAAGDGDLSLGLGANFILRVDAGKPVVILAGGHVGCYELFGTSRIRSIKDLRGRAVAVPNLGGGAHVFLSMMLAHVGLDPRKDVQWVTEPVDEAMTLLAEGKVDGFLGFPPEPQELRARRIGHVLFNTTTDRPWSQYFCCMIGGNREFVRQHPVATKRALRAILKAADLCALDPDRATRVLVDRGFTQKPAYTRQMLVDIPYRRWREYNPEDAVRFYALRLQEAGMIRSSPQKILAHGTDWRVFQELKRELKG